MNFLVIGNITKDLLKTKDKEVSSFGGTSYSAIAALKLGYDSKILTRGNNTLDKWIKYLEKLGIEILLQADRKATSFINDYSNDRRIQMLLEHTGKIIYESNKKFDIIHLNPIYQEIGVETINNAKRNCEILSLDVQGLIRDKKGKKVVGRFLQEREEFLRNIDILKIGKNETRFLSHNKDYRNICKELKSFGVKIITLTLGNNGSIIHENEFYRIPTFKTKTIDRTGAGDVYGTSFVIKYFETKDVIDSALFAAASASFVVEDFGPNSIASREEIEERFGILKNMIFRSKRISHHDLML